MDKLIISTTIYTLVTCPEVIYWPYYCCIFSLWTAVGIPCKRVPYFLIIFALVTLYKMTSLVWWRCTHTKYFGVKNVSLDTFFLTHCFWHSKLTQLTQHNRHFDIAYVITVTSTHLLASMLLRHTWMSQVRQKKEARKGLWVTPFCYRLSTVKQLMLVGS